jgi:hypothetical protein
MKKPYRILSLLILAFAVTLNSCLEEDLDGFFGDPVERVLGTWKCEERGDINGLIGPFTVEVVRTTSGTGEVMIKNISLLGMHVSATAIVTGSTITIPQQRLSGKNSIQVQGSGGFSNGGFTISYKSNDGADEENINARFFR